MSDLLPVEFYLKKTDLVAQKLIGKILARRLPSGIVLKSVITETEAYLGLEDKACHTYGGRQTKRTEVMWGPPGIAYVYLIYGMYYCLNAVTRREGEPEAVLIRGARPLETRDQIPVWLKKVPNIKLWPKIMSGPGKLCRTLEISTQHNGLPLQSDLIWIEEGFQVQSKTILKTPRIGIAYSQEAQHWPLRFLWNSGRQYESLFRYYKNNRKNASHKNEKSR